jgi:hypothetical protein
MAIFVRPQAGQTMPKRKSKSGSFEGRWRRRERECGLDKFGPTEFLRAGKVVLPLSAAPFLSFDEAQELPYVHEVYGRSSDYATADRRRLANYWMIGSDGSGNPMCISVRTGAIWLLDHEDHFRTRQFVNSSVALLAECLLTCLGENDPNRLLTAIKKLDPPAARKGTFWDEAAMTMRESSETI